jgi:hypothetical protein
MGAVRDAAINGFNEIIEDIKTNAEAEGAGETFTSLYVFNNKTKVIFKDEPVTSLTPLTRETYIPRGSTALRDCIGQAVADLEEADTFEGDTAALLVIISDGEENSSVEYSGEQIRQLVKEKEHSGFWTFTFMLANVDIRKVQQDFAAQAGNVGAFVVTDWDNMTANMGDSLTNYYSARKLGETTMSSFHKKKSESLTP